MVDHKTRIRAITAVLLVSIVGLVILTSLGIESGTGLGVLSGLVAALVPAWFDATSVRRRGFVDNGVSGATPITPTPPE